MAWKKKDPRKGHEAKTHTWTCHHPKGPWTLKAWLAGPSEWVLCHYLDRHLPCHHEMSDGKIRCPYCHQRPRVDWIGYTPVYSASGKPLVVMIREYSRDVVAKLETHAAVLVSRGGERYDEVTVIPHRWAEKYVPGLPHRKAPADITGWLLKLWKDETWAAWCRKSTTSDTAVSLPTPPTVEGSMGNELLDLVEKNGICRTLVDQSADAAFERAAEQSKAVRRSPPRAELPELSEVLPLPAPGQNGKHK